MRLVVFLTLIMFSTLARAQSPEECARENQILHDHYAESEEGLARLRSEAKIQQASETRSRVMGYAEELAKVLNEFAPSIDPEEKTAIRMLRQKKLTPAQFEAYLAQLSQKLAKVAWTHAKQVCPGTADLEDARGNCKEKWAYFLKLKRKRISSLFVDERGTQAYLVKFDRYYPSYRVQLPLLETLQTLVGRGSFEAQDLVDLLVDGAGNRLVPAIDARTQGLSEAEFMAKYLSPGCPAFGDGLEASDEGSPIAN